MQGNTSIETWLVYNAYVLYMPHPTATAARLNILLMIAYDQIWNEFIKNFRRCRLDTRDRGRMEVQAD